MYLISSHKKGVSSHQLSRDLDVTQKTAWFILHKVRTLFAQYDTPALEGEIELDEMYLGGWETNKHQSKKTEGTQGRSTKTKTPIFGMVQRDGLVHMSGLNAIPLSVRDRRKLLTVRLNGMPISGRRIRQVLFGRCPSARGLSSDSNADR